MACSAVLGGGGGSLEGGGEDGRDFVGSNFVEYRSSTYIILILVIIESNSCFITVGLYPKPYHLAGSGYDSMS